MYIFKIIYNFKPCILIYIFIITNELLNNFFIIISINIVDIKNVFLNKLVLLFIDSIHYSVVTR